MTTDNSIERTLVEEIFTIGQIIYGEKNSLQIGQIAYQKICLLGEKSSFYEKFFSSHRRNFLEL